jgi:hypothetical protein
MFIKFKFWLIVKKACMKMGVVTKVRAVMKFLSHVILIYPTGVDKEYCRTRG